MNVPDCVAAHRRVRSLFLGAGGAEAAFRACLASTGLDTDPRSIQQALPPAARAALTRSIRAARSGSSTPPTSTPAR